MSYLNKCIVKETLNKRKLKPSFNLIIFVVSENVYIPVTRQALKFIMKNKENHCIEGTKKFENFFKLSNEIWVDSSLETCFNNRNNTMKLKLSANRFKMECDSDSENVSDKYVYYYTATATLTTEKEIGSDEESMFSFENGETEVEYISDDESDSNEESDTKIQYIPKMCYRGRSI